MDEFEELSGSEAAAAVTADPASEFLEREKEELGDVLGEEPAPAVPEPGTTLIESFLASLLATILWHLSAYVKHRIFKASYRPAKWLVQRSLDTGSWVRIPAETIM